LKAGSGKIALLIESLDHPDKAVVRAAVDSLIAASSQDLRIAQLLHQLLLERKRKNLWPIAYILAHLPETSVPCLEVLLDALGDPDPDIRWAILLLLVRLGQKDRALVGRLLDLSRTGSPTQKRMALYCIRDLKLQDPRSLQALRASLNDPEPAVRVAGVTSLRTRPDISREETEELLRLLKEDRDVRVRCSAAMILAQIGGTAEEVHTALRAAASNGDPRLRKAARAALDYIQKRPATPAE